MSRTAVVTGASSGIGAATVRRLVKEGFHVVAGARRTDRLRALSDETGCEWKVLDVTDAASVESFAAGTGEVHLLVNNAGGAKGFDTIEHAHDDDWTWMYETNVLGTMRVTRAFLPALRASGDGHIVLIGSIAGIEPYEGGAGYNAAKAAERAVSKVLRLELFGEPIRVTEILPGLVSGAEFSVVRFGGDEDRARKVYEGTTPLNVDDIADAIAWVATRPSHVNIDEMVIKPRDQANARQVKRQP